MAEIVEEEMRTLSSNSTGLPNVKCLIRAANRQRQKVRPPEPKDLDFVLTPDQTPPGFLQGDVRVGKGRHLIFATDQQAKLLLKARRWYVDGTFKVIYSILKSTSTYLYRGCLLTSGFLGHRGRYLVSLQVLILVL